MALCFRTDLHMYGYLVESNLMFGFDQFTLTRQEHAHARGGDSRGDCIRDSGVLLFAVSCVIRPRGKQARPRAGRASLELVESPLRRTTFTLSGRTFYFSFVVT